MVRLLQVMLFLSVFSILTPVLAAWEGSGQGEVVSVRTYQVGPDGLRAQIQVTASAGHTCGNGPTHYYFDTGKVPLDVVKAALSLASAAMIAGKSVALNYDCSLSAGGYGWATAINMLR